GTLTATGVRQVTVFQRNDAGRTMPPPDVEATVPFRFSGNTLRLQIIPQLPGRVRFEIHVTLANGGELVQRAERTVKIRDNMLRELHGHGSDHAFLFMQLDGLPLAPYGVFSNIPEDVPLDD